MCYLRQIRIASGQKKCHPTQCLNQMQNMNDKVVDEYYTTTKTFRMNLFLRRYCYWVLNILNRLWTNGKKVTIESARKLSMNNDGKLERILKCRSFWCRRQIVYHKNCEKKNDVTKSGENNCFLELLNRDADVVVVVDIFS